MNLVKNNIFMQQSSLRIIFIFFTYFVLFLFFNTTRIVRKNETENNRQNELIFFCKGGLTLLMLASGFRGFAGGGAESAQQI